MKVVRSIAAALVLGPFVFSAAGFAAPAQSLRLCVDRWNQGRMVDWGPAVASVTTAHGCTIAVAYVYDYSPAFSCAPGIRWRPHPEYCLERHSTFVCKLNLFGAYECPGHVNGARLRDENAFINHHGRLAMASALVGTRPVPELPWQKRYTYRDGYIYPWTSAGTLRPGLRLRGKQSGDCGLWVGAGYRCVLGHRLISPCYPQRAGLRTLTPGACATAPGSTTFLRVAMKPL